MTKKIPIDVLDLDDVKEAMSHLWWSEVTADSVLPFYRGIYVWIDENDRLMYVGKAENVDGLKGRLRTHNREKIKLEGKSDRARRTTVRGVLAGLMERNARVVFAASDAPAEDEATLIAFSVLITGYTPLLNGLGWDWDDASIASSNRAVAVAERLGR